VAHSHDEFEVAQPEIVTLHWEGPARVQAPPEHRFPDSAEEQRQALDAEREGELQRLSRTRRGREIWELLRQQAAQRGDEGLWRRKLHAYAWVKLQSEGTAGDYARRFGVNHATVRTWISEVAKLAYQVGYRLHEDRLVLVGEAPAELQRLRELVNRNARSPEALRELRLQAPRFRGEDPYFHLNEGHVLRAQGKLRASDATLREGLTIAEAPRVRSLLWNARGQTWWDCTPESPHPLRDYLARAERAFRRAAVLDPTTFFPFVNLAQLAVDSGDARRCEYWIGELASARRKMEEPMKEALAQYLQDAEWTRSVEPKRFWRDGPGRWLREAAAKGLLTLLAALLVAGALGPPTAAAATHAGSLPETTANDGRRGSNDGGAGGN
jgi:hypothetical protein